MIEEMKKEFEEKFRSNKSYYQAQSGIIYWIELWGWIESKLKSEIAEACKKQREILNDNIGSWKESMKFAIQHAIEQQEQEYREDYFLGREEAFKYAVRMHDEHFNAPSPLDEVK